MTINLHDITGQESGIIVYKDGTIHSGTLNDEIAHDGLEDWNPLNDDLESDEPCDVYPLSNGWIVVAPKEWN